jgi:ArsR family transcriptional regulator, arsenate/arsenite/antimonite-responsive transcriptional repressor
MRTPGNNARVLLASDAERLAQMLKALGNPVRFQIMQTLAERRSCITQEIVDTTPLAQSTVSQHLRVLREAGLIQGEIEGPATCYCIDPAGVRWLKEQIGSWLPGCCEPAIPARGDQAHRNESLRVALCATRSNEK